MLRTFVLGAQLWFCVRILQPPRHGQQVISYNLGAKLKYCPFRINSCMRLAVFTNKFPHRISTFFARDMRALIDAGIELDIFPFYPLEPDLWRYVPDILNEKVLPRTRIHHIDLNECFTFETWTNRRL